MLFIAVNLAAGLVAGYRGSVRKVCVHSRPESLDALVKVAGRKTKESSGKFWTAKSGRSGMAVGSRQGRV